MRARLIFAWSLAAWACGVAPAARADEPAPTPSDVEQARGLDREGARAFREGRYNDAIRFFQDAYKLGAPDVELWNVARCYLKLDEPEEASRALNEYLARPDLSPRDRADARAQLTQLEKRRSTLTVTSSPSGAYALVDGRPIGRTPATTDLPPGEHVVAIRRDGRTIDEEHVTARFGRAVLVDGFEGGQGSVDEPRPRRFTADAELAVLWARLGKFPGPGHPGGVFGVGFVPYDRGRWALTVGVRALVTMDTWGDGIAGDNTPVGGPNSDCQVPPSHSATALSAFVAAALGYRPVSRLRLSADAGLGIAGYFLDRGGGDVFEPTCAPSPGVKAALLTGLSASWNLTPAVRVVASPLWLTLQPAFDGARSAPIDAAEAWVRVGSGLGVAIDL